MCHVYIHCREIVDITPTVYYTLNCVFLCMPHDMEFPFRLSDVGRSLGSVMITVVLLQVAEQNSRYTLPQEDYWVS